jgi:hypothetical protein
MKRLGDKMIPRELTTMWIGTAGETARVFNGLIARAYPLGLW